MCNLRDVVRSTGISVSRTHYGVKLIGSELEQRAVNKRVRSQNFLFNCPTPPEVKERTVVVVVPFGRELISNKLWLGDIRIRPVNSEFIFSCSQSYFLSTLLGM